MAAINIWQADFYRRPLQSSDGQPLWELLVCSADQQFTYGATCEQSAANAQWLIDQLTVAVARWSKAGLGESSHQRPEQIQVFRPQSLSLIQAAGESLGILVQPNRATPALKRWLGQRATWYATLPGYTGEAYDPLAIDRPPPNPLPEHLWGDQWRFAAIAANEFQQTFPYEPIPVQDLPAEKLPLALGLSSTTLIPGVVIDAGRQAMPLALWLQAAQPVSLNAMAGAPNGLILEAGLADRWIVATFDDATVTTAAKTFEQRKQQSQGLHFLLVRPDDSGMTHTGIWLL
ncbi:MAG: Tab2/Atab2 family RNA-binding protein [Cyanobacteria bacterium P01_A01_bin.123]